jgi:hypothetical protein
MRFSFALSLAVTVGLAGWAMGQNPPATPRPVEPPPQPALATSYPATLYNMPDVGRSLNLNEKQINQLTKLTDQTAATYRPQYQKLSSLTEAERAARSAELDRPYSADWMKGAADVLDEKQLQRYQQLNYQYGGFNSLSDPVLQKRLNLTDEQVRKLADNVNWSNEQMQQITRQGGTDRDKALQAYRDYQKTYQDRFNQFLTPEQLKTWQQLTGEPYSFQPAFAGQRR